MQNQSIETYPTCLNHLMTVIKELFTMENLSFAHMSKINTDLVDAGKQLSLNTQNVRRTLHKAVCGLIDEYIESFAVNQPKDDDLLILGFLKKYQLISYYVGIISCAIPDINSSLESGDGLFCEHDISCQLNILWKKKYADTLAKDIGSALLRKICLDRGGDINAERRRMLRQAIEIFYNMDKENCEDYIFLEPHSEVLPIYQLAIEKPLLEQIRQECFAVFTSNYSAEKILDYFRICTQHIMNENIRIASTNADQTDGYIPLQTSVKIMKMTRAALVNFRLSPMCEHFAHLLQTDQIEALNVIYKLSIYFPEARFSLAQLLGRHVVTVGEAAIAKLNPTSMNIATEYFEAALGLYRKYRSIVTEQLGDDKIYCQALLRALNMFVNSNQITRQLKNRKVAEYFAHYCDQLLRQWAKRRPNDEQLQMALDGIGLIFNSLNEVDVFELQYSQLYAKRIVGAITLPDSEEADIIARFKKSNYVGLVRRIETLNKDALLSRELTEQFKAQKFATSFSLNISVIQHNCWPLALDPVACTLPPVLTTCIDEFTQFYKENQKSKRKLNWVHHHSRGELSYHTPKKTYVLELSTYQMCLLLMFNDRTSCTLEELAALTSLPIDVLIENLEILINNELIVASAGDVMDKDSELALNMNYSNVKRMVHLKQRTATKKTKDENAANGIIFRNRKLAMHAAVVRIMKRERVLDVNTIVTKVVQEINRYFTVDIKELKLVLKTLVDKEYIKQRENHPEKYEYLA